MKADLEYQLEDEFDFSIFGRFQATRNEILANQGKILYVPTTIPVPLDKQVLNSLVDSDQVRILSMPRDSIEFEESVYTGIEYLVEERGEATALFFCPRKLVDEFNQIPGSEFITFERIELEDSTRTVRQTFSLATDQNLEPDTVTDLSEFALRVFTAATIGTELDPAHIQTGTSDSLEEFYVSFDRLSEVPNPIRTYFLESLNLSNIDLYDRLPEIAQQNVYISLLLEKYGDQFAEQEAKYDVASSLTYVDEDILQILRRLIVTWQVEGRLFNSKIRDLAPGYEGRDFIDKVQRSYQRVTGTSDRINTQNPETAAETLRDHFGILFSDISQDDLDEVASIARERLSVQSQQVEEFSPQNAVEEVEHVDRLLWLLAEVALVRGSRFVNDALPPERWEEIFQPFVEVAMDNDRDDLLDFRFLTSLNEARKDELRQREVEGQAEEIRELPVRLDTLPTFLDYWCEFIVETRSTGASELLRQELIDTYDSFCDEVVENYEDIVTGQDQAHISDLLAPETDDNVRIFVIIDSFGYTDYRLLKQFNFLEDEPDDMEVIYSNLPSYTPSAMASILSGLPAEETGIYGWQPRRGNEIFNLRRKGYETEDFDFVDQSSNNSFQLIQRPQLNSSGITLFAKTVADLRISPGTRVQGELLDSVEDAFIEELENVVEERNRVLDNSELPEAAREALKSDIAIYLEDFDQYLHQEMSLAEFENYYRVLGNFVSSMLDRIRSIAQDSIDDPVDVIFASDHGKITRYEMDLILNERPEYEFNQQMLSNSVELDQAYLVNFRRADFTNRSGRYYLSVADGDTEPPVAQVKLLLDEDEDATEEELLTVIEQVDYTVSGSKFMFGWTDSDLDEAKRELQRLRGVDTYLPDGEGVFDLPDIGILSRYDIKNRSAHDHGYHGGTSISEMAALRLTFKKVN